MRISMAALLLSLPALWPSISHGALITYVDALTSNTTVNGVAADFTTGTGNATTSTGGGVSNDGKWHARTTVGLGIGNTLLETDTSGSANPGTFETTDPLITTIALPGPGTYQLYGHWWSSITANNYYDISFRVGSTGGFTIFDRTNSATAAVSDFVAIEKVLTNSNTWELRTSDLGLHTFTDANPTVSIYVNGPDRTDSTYLNLSPTPNGLPGNNWLAQRTVYEGVGYELVPEPASGICIAVGMFGLLAIRRRAR